LTGSFILMVQILHHCCVEFVQIFVTFAQRSIPLVNHWFRYIGRLQFPKKCLKWTKMHITN